jgi:ribosomal protein L31E
LVGISHQTRGTLTAKFIKDFVARVLKVENIFELVIDGLNNAIFS